MFLSGGDFHRRYRPGRCDLRLYLHHQGVQAAEPGPYEAVLQLLGERHEQAHLASLPDALDLSKGTPTERCEGTLEAIRAGTPIIYQPLFRCITRLGGLDWEIGGAPDFLIREDGGYVVRDVKMARRINEKDHPEIFWQMRLYGWLLERSTDQAPRRLEVFAGTGEIVQVDPLDAAPLKMELSKMAAVIVADSPPFEPVGWSKCGGCGYWERCWTEAEKSRSVALLPKADQGLVRWLHDAGVHSFDEMLAQFDVAKLAEVRRPWGGKMRRVGESAANEILRSAEALANNTMIQIAPPQLLDSPNYAILDLEGLPPQLDELEKVYLWGLQVFGERPSQFMPAMAGFGIDGDRAGWEEFLRNAAGVLASYGDIPFLHWHHYERVKLDMYLERYGDRSGIGARVRDNLFDLLPATQKAVALPVPSYSLKVIEDYVGFARTQADYGGDWAMARYIEATEVEDERQRDAVLDEILRYNEEDLAATWKVFCWLRALSQGAQSA